MTKSRQTPDPLRPRPVVTEILSRTELADALRSRRNAYVAPACLSLTDVGTLANGMLQLLFPHFGGGCKQATDMEERIGRIEQTLLAIVSDLKDQIDPALSADQVVGLFLSSLPDIADMCGEDADTLLKNDPAAQSLDEVILSYPGFYAVAVYRLAHKLLRLGVPLLPRLMTEFAHQKTGIDIHPAAQIGRRFYIDHGTGVVIGGTAIIGDSVKLYQGVTIGALRVDLKDPAAKRHPTIGDHVVIYASATILGGDTSVGAHSIIGGNVWLTKSVPEHSRVMFNGEDGETVFRVQSQPPEPAEPSAKSS